MGEYFSSLLGATQAACLNGLHKRPAERPCRPLPVADFNQDAGVIHRHHKCLVLVLECSAYQIMGFLFEVFALLGLCRATSFLGSAEPKVPAFAQKSSQVGVELSGSPRFQCNK